MFVVCVQWEFLNYCKVDLVSAGFTIIADSVSSESQPRLGQVRSPDFTIVPPNSALYIELIQGVFASSSPLVSPETKIDIELMKIKVFGRALLSSVTVLASGGIFSNFWMYLSIHACSKIYPSIVECANSAVENRYLLKLGTLLYIILSSWVQG